ncbi:hypothetical protein BH09VER1_BH09VER1_22480 [soil metagenome]
MDTLSHRPRRRGKANLFWNRPAVVLGGVFLLLVLIGFLDYATGFDLSFSIFYLLPIIWAGWRLGLGIASLIAILSVLIINWVDWLAGADVPGLIPFWNSLIQLAFYLTVLWLLMRWKGLRLALETRVRERTRDLSAEIALRAELEREILDISEREQRRIGYDLHDILCQHLAATALAAKVLESKLSSESTKEAGHVVEMTESGLTIARDIARGLSPIPAGEGNVRYALEDLAGNTRELFKISCRVETDGPEFTLNPDHAIHLYRIAQESVSNAIRHGKARSIVLSVSRIGNRGIMTIQDDGTGLQNDEQTDSTRMGLRIMRQRAEMLGGNLDILNEASLGLTISCSFPIKEEIPLADDVPRPEAEADFPGR